METQPDLTLAKTSNDNTLSNVQPTIDYSKMPPELAMASVLGNSGVALGTAITNAVVAGINANAQVKASQNALKAKVKELEKAKVDLESAQIALKTAEEGTKQVADQEVTKRQEIGNKFEIDKKRLELVEKIETQKIAVSRHYAETHRLQVTAHIETRKVETQVLLEFARTNPEFAMQIMKLAYQTNQSNAAILASQNGFGMHSPRASHQLEDRSNEDPSDSNLLEYKK